MNTPTNSTIAIAVQLYSIMYSQSISPCRYAKRGLYEGPCGEQLKEPLEAPSLEPNIVVSILISSDFLKMDSLVGIVHYIKYQLVEVYQGWIGGGGGGELGGLHPPGWL